MLKKIIVFLVINFGALALGAMFTNEGVISDWYADLNKAPWTPPGWVFGAAWTTIMICFSIYMAKAWTESKDLKKLGILFAIQWVLNVAWNPIFFQFHHVAFGLIVISALALLIGYFLINYKSTVKSYTLLILPYLIWMIIATSLNAYIFLNN